MPLVEDGRIVEDRYRVVEGDAPIPHGMPVIVAAERLSADADALAGRAAPVGVTWPNNRPIADLAPHLGALALVALVFPSFRDGRAYSQARLLRERCGFDGQLRATGQVLRDQFGFLVRAGFDSFDVRKQADAETFAAVLHRYSVAYQPAGDGRVPVPCARVKRPIAAAADAHFPVWTP